MGFYTEIETLIWTYVEVLLNMYVVNFESFKGEVREVSTTGVIWPDQNICTEELL